MRYKKSITVVDLILLLSLSGCKGKLSMEEQAWQEAINYIEWFAGEKDADVKPGIYSEERVVQNSETNYTCCVAVSNSKGAYAQWYISGEQKVGGDWEVLSID